MRKLLVAIPAVALLLSACGGYGTTPHLIIPTSGDSLERVNYSDAQVQVYKDAVIYEMQRLNAVEGLTFDTDVSDESWGPYVVRAKALCDDARTRGWESAVETYTAQMFDEAMNAMPEAAGDLSDFEPFADEILTPISNVQLRAIAADGSLCPEVAPVGFGTVIDPDVQPTPEGEPVLDGKYFGEGCEGAGNALFELLGLFQGIEDGSTDISSFEQDITNIAGGLRYSSLTERNTSAVQEMNKGVEVLAGLLVALKSGDAGTFGDAMMTVSDQAIAIIDACGLQ